MVTMRHWRMENVITTTSVPKNNNVMTTFVIDPLEGTSKQYQCSSNQSIFNGPIIKKTPSTPECEEVLAELRKKYYNPREGTSKQFVETTTFPIKLEPSTTFVPTLQQQPHQLHLQPVQFQIQKQPQVQIQTIKLQAQPQPQFQIQQIHPQPKRSPPVDEDAELDLQAKLIYHAYRKRPKSEPKSSPETGQTGMELLRKCIQYAFDQEVDVIIKKFLRDLFVPAMRKIREGYGENSVSDEVLVTVCHNLLENAKAQYKKETVPLLASLIKSDPDFDPSPETDVPVKSEPDTADLPLTTTPNAINEPPLSLSTATTPKMELSETESDNSLNYSSTTSGCGSILQQALKGDRSSYETETSENTETTTEDENMADEFSDELLGKIAEEISEEDLSQAFSFEDSLLSDIPCFSLSPPPLMDALSSNDFKVPLPPISTITSSLSKPYVPFSSLFSTNAEPCLDFIDFDLE